MAGLFGLFGGGNQEPQSKEPFFLDEDEAKTYGDYAYMRKPVVIRRTFAKKKGQEEEMESIRSVSASTSRNVDEAVKPTTPSFGAYTSTFTPPAPSTPTPSTPAPVEEPTAEAETPAAPAQEPTTQRTDTSMDLFRSMAKSIRR